MRRARDPFFWGLFSGGGMLTALLLPALFLVTAITAPMGWFGMTGYEEWATLAGHPLTRAGLLLVAFLAFFHAAHRFRYTLYDGLQLYHLDALISIVTYGVAAVLTVLAAALLILVV